MQSEERMMAREASRMWWVFLIAGILWLVISWVVLRMDVTSIATVGVLIGVMFVAAAVNEVIFAANVVGGWKILHYVMAAIFVLGSLWGFFRPVNTFFALASVLGLVLFLMGGFEIIRGVASKGESDLWWLAVVVGILEVLLAFWVSQRYYPARAQLILLWVGFMAMFRGIGQIALAYAIRRAGKVLAVG